MLSATVQIYLTQAGLVNGPRLLIVFEYHRIKQYVAFQLILTEGGERTPQEGLETACPGIRSGRGPTHIHHTAPVKRTGRYHLTSWEPDMDCCLCHRHLLSQTGEAATQFCVVRGDSILWIFNLHNNNL